MPSTEGLPGTQGGQGPSTFSRPPLYIFLSKSPVSHQALGPWGPHSPAPSGNILLLAGRTDGQNPELDEGVKSVPADRQQCGLLCYEPTG